jgi:cytochrome c oxidase assembly protein subunit 15
VLSRLIASVWQPGTRALRGWALASVIANAVIISTGAAVRLSASGLGCPDWPTCTKTSLVAAHSTGETSFNTAVEFTNRMLTYPLVIIAGLAFIAFLRYYQAHRVRKDLMWLSLVLPLGVVAQAVVGGILVLEKLNPTLVSAHFLLSAAIILTSAVVLHARAAAFDNAAAGLPPQPTARADLRATSFLLVCVTTVMLAAGTVVTGTGPLAGTTIDQNGHLATVPRYHFNLADVTQLHADVGWFIAALAVALVVGLRYGGATRRTVRLSWIVLAGFGIQGVIGYVQYFNHLPAGLVWVHVSSSVVVWIFVLQLFLSTGSCLPGAARGAGSEDSAAAEPPIKTTIL